MTGATTARGDRRARAARVSRMVAGMLAVVAGLAGASVGAQTYSVDLAQMPSEAFRLFGDGYQVPFGPHPVDTTAVDRYRDADAMLELRMPRPQLPTVAYYRLVPQEPIGFPELSALRLVSLTAVGRSERIGVGVIMTDATGATREFFMGYLDFEGPRSMHFYPPLGGADRFDPSAGLPFPQPRLDAIHFYLPENGYPLHDRSVVGVIELEVVGR